MSEKERVGRGHLTFGTAAAAGEISDLRRQLERISKIVKSWEIGTSSSTQAITNVRRVLTEG